MRYAVILFLIAGCITPPTTTVPATTTTTLLVELPPPVEPDLPVRSSFDDDIRTAIEAKPVVLPTYSRPSTPIPSDRLRSLVETYMQPADVDLMLRVAWCESGYNTNAKNSRSTASGLFQHLKGWWSGAWGVTGPFDPFNPEQSVKAAADLLYETTSGISNWKASYHCWWQTIG